MSIYNKLLEGLEQEGKLAAVTEIKFASGMIQDMMRREIWAEAEAPEEIRNHVIRTLKGGVPELIETKQNELLFIEPFYKAERLIILGGGHIALPLVEFGAKLGFSTIVADDRPSFANEGRFPLAQKVICDSFENAIKGLHISETDYVVVVTRGHRHDAVCLRELFRSEEPAYLGMIGSKRRVIALKKMLIDEGLDASRMERVCSPIGLPIGAVTPEEIAVSIIGEVIRRKRLERSVTEGKDRYINRSDLDFSIIELLTVKEREPKAVITILSASGSVPRGAGAKMIVYPGGFTKGSIGGGCSEGAVIRNAIKIIGSGRFEIVTIDLSGDVAADEGMVCGGSMKVLIEDGAVF